MEVPFKPKPLLNKSELKQIKRSRTKIQGKKVVTDDVLKLKSLKVTPDIDPSEATNYYREPIWIEYYIPKESRFAYETKYLFVFLVDPPPRSDGLDAILNAYKERGNFLDIIQVAEDYPDHKDLILRSYHDRMGMFENIHKALQSFQHSDSAIELKSACYVTEALMKYEPTVASLKLFPDFLVYNLNWLIRQLNLAKIPFSLEDTTISLLIKRRNEHWEAEGLPEDSDFDLLSALFYEQAFPHRGAEELEPDDFIL